MASPSLNTINGVMELSGRFQRCYRIRLAAEKTEDIRHTGLGHEIFHFIVQQESRASHGNRGTVRRIDGVGIGDEIAVHIGY